MTDVTQSWHDRDDEDLTSEDIDAMISSGQPVTVTGPTPHVPGGGYILDSSRVTTLGDGRAYEPVLPYRPIPMLAGGRATA